MALRDRSIPKWKQIQQLRDAGQNQQANILSSGGRLRQAEKTQELAARVDGSGFIFKGDTYTLRPGEDYFSLAQRLYGNSSYFAILQSYNNGLIPKPGMTIKIPRIRNTGAGTTATTTAAENSSTSPAVAGAPQTGYNVQGIQGLGAPAVTPNLPTGQPAPYAQLAAQGVQPQFQSGPQRTIGGLGPRPTTQLGQSSAAPQATPTPLDIQPFNFAPTSGPNAPSFANPLPSKFAPSIGAPKTQTGQQGPNQNFVSAAVFQNLEGLAASITSGDAPPVIAPQVIEVLGLETQARAAGYVIQDGVWKIDPVALDFLNQSAASFNNGGSVPRPDISYRRRTAKEITRGDEAAGNVYNYDTGGYARYSDYSSNNLGPTINWRVGFG